MTHLALIAFAGRRCLAEGDAITVALAIRQAQDAGEASPVQVFEDTTGRPVDLDLRGSAEDIRNRYALIEPPPRGPGRPKLGVVAREITLLPRHWDWLASQPGGASVALRRLVDEARHASEATDRLREAREAAYRFMSAMAGNEPHYEEAIRALFAGDDEKFAAMIADWPDDVSRHAHKLAEAAFTTNTATAQGSGNGHVRYPSANGGLRA
ncbi:MULTISPECIES: DUF2239 family protein [Labrys]|uniref:DUF2239 family protein n=1 Tax=Labrys neptuniae TaxID=376174 RepID=A0ABV3PRR8_9HYPH